MNLEFLKQLQNNSMMINFFILFIAVSLMQFLDSQILSAISVLMIALVNYPTILEVFSDKKRVKKDIKKDDISDDMYYNTSIHDLLVQLKPFKKYNKVSYKDGVKYIRKFFKTLKILEHDDLYNRNQYFELANDYLKQAINHFQSISVSMPERSFKDAIKYGEFESTKKTNQLSTILKELYNQCYYILLNIGITYNESWSKQPNIYTREIDLNTDRVESYTKNDEVNWALF